MTEHIARRWPAAQITDVDGSREMLEAARARLSSMSWFAADLSQ